MASSLPLGTVVPRLVRGPIVGTAHGIAAALAWESARPDDLSDVLSADAHMLVENNPLLPASIRFSKGALLG